MSGRLGQKVFERAQHQRERRSKLMADVGEERRLGAVDFGQGLGAAALLFVSARVGESRRHLDRKGAR